MGKTGKLLSERIPSASAESFVEHPSSLSPEHKLLLLTCKWQRDYNQPDIYVCTSAHSHSQFTELANAINNLPMKAIQEINRGIGEKAAGIYCHPDDIILGKLFYIRNSVLQSLTKRTLIINDDDLTYSFIVQEPPLKRRPSISSPDLKAREPNCGKAEKSPRLRLTPPKTPHHHIKLLQATHWTPHPDISYLVSVTIPEGSSLAMQEAFQWLRDSSELGIASSRAAYSTLSEFTGERKFTAKISLLERATNAYLDNTGKGYLTLAPFTPTTSPEGAAANGTSPKSSQRRV